MFQIKNDSFDALEKVYLEFVLEQEFPKKKCFLEQLGAMVPEDLVRDVTPCYRILEFRPAGTRPGYDGMRPVAQITVGAPIPTVITLYERDGRVFELEVYRVDSSELDPDKLIHEIIKEREE